VASRFIGVGVGVLRNSCCYLGRAVDLDYDLDNDNT